MNTPGFKLSLKAIGLALSVLLSASPAGAEGDADQGAKLGYTCLGCHGIEGYRNGYPSFRVPRLGGQKAEYLDTALKAYRSGTRPHPTMQAQASTMSDDDIDNLVAWIGSFGEAEDTLSSADVAGVAPAQICVTCHGAEGANVMPKPPVLSGQHADYLVHALGQYKDGSRSGNVMTAFAATLSEADMKLLATIYASQEGLQTLD